MRTLAVSFDVLLALIIVLAFAIKFYGFQTYVAKQLAAIMSAELGAEVSIDYVEIDPVKKIQISGILIKDLHNDTLFYSPRVRCLLDNYSIRKRFIHFSEMEIKTPRLKLAKYKNEKDLNFEFLADYFDDGKPEKKKKGKPWKVYCHRIRMAGANLSMNNYNKPLNKFGVDFDHLGIYPLNVSLSEFKNHGDTSTFSLKNLSLHEQSGFMVDTLNTRITITPNSITLTPLTIRTPFSKIHSPYLSFEFNDLGDFDYFEKRVKMVTHFQDSKLYLGDLAYFANELKGSRQMLRLNGKFDGTVNNFSAENFTIAYSKHTMLKGDFKIRNITKINDAYFECDIKKFAALGKELKSFEVPPYNRSSFIDLPNEIKRMGDIDYTGTFKGSLRNFYSKGSLLTGSGLLTNDIHYKQKFKSDYFDIEGKITAKDFQLGKVLNESDLGNITGNIRLKGFGKDFKRYMKMRVEANIPQFGFNNYNYNNITVNGNILNGTFTGDIKVKDEYVHLLYSGFVNYLNPEYNFTAKVYNAAITKLNFGNRDETATMSFKIKTKAKGLKIDELRGDITIYDLNFCEKGKEYDFDSVKIFAKEMSDSSKKIFFDSEFAKLEVNGNFNYEELPVVFESILSKAIPSLFDNKIVNVETREIFEYKIKLKDLSKIEELFIPDLNVTKDVSIDGKFDSDKNVFRFSAKNITKLKYGDQYFEDLRVVLKNNNELLNTTVKAKNFQINDSIHLQELDIQSDALANNTESTIKWKNTSGNEGTLKLTGEIAGHNKFNFTVDTSSRVRIQQGLWTTENFAQIKIDSSTIHISNFLSKSKKQSIAINGIISKNPDDKMIVDINDFKVESVTPLLIGTGIAFKGDLNGDVEVSNVYETPDFVNKIYIDSFFVNNEWVGDINAENHYEKGTNKIITEAKILRNGKATLSIDGSYKLRGKKDFLVTPFATKIETSDSLNYAMRFKETNIKFLNGFLPPDVSNFQSLVDGLVTLTGTPDVPEFNGKLRIHDGGVKITMLNTSYFLENGTIDIFPDMIALNTMKISDVKGNQGVVNGTFNHKNFKNSDYAFDLAFEKMLCLNTTEEMNDLYFGKAYATGTASILGYGDKIDVEITAKTEKNSKLTMPMYGVSDVTVGDFVQFVKKDSVKEKEINLDGITLVFNLDVTPDAEVNIVFDKLSGAQLKARGAGPIKMEITPLGDFIMNGEYEVDDPSTYKLAMQSIINKNFIVKKGGKIKWFGDPLNAEIDLTAVYPLQASVFDIMPIDVQSRYRKNVHVNVEIQLKNSLYKPDFVFDFIVPKADEAVRSAVVSVKQTKEELFRQTMSLLIINKFLTPSNAIGTASTNAGGNIAANYTSELITNQLNSLLSQISKDFDIGVNYKPGDEISNEEIAVALSKQILNGRMSISGNFGVSNTAAAANTGSSSFIGDFNLEYLITDDGALKARAYNESNDFNITNQQQAPYTQGVAFSFQREYDVVPAFQKVLNVFRRKDKDWVNPDSRTRKEKKQARKEQRKKEKDLEKPGEEKGNS